MKNGILYFLSLNCLFLLWNGTVVSSAATLAPYAARHDSPQHNSIQYNESKEEYSMVYKDDSIDILFTLSNHDSYLQRGMVSVRAILNGKDRFIPVYQSGPVIQDVSGTVWQPSDAAGRSCKLISHKLQGNEILYQFEDHVDGLVLHHAYRYRLQGRALIVRATGETIADATAWFAGFDVGNSRASSFPVLYQFPMSPISVASVGQKYFMSTYVDPLLSSMGRYENNLENAKNRLRVMNPINTPAWLLPNGQGVRPALDTTLYITFSDRILDVVPVGDPPMDKNAADACRRMLIDVDQLPMANQLMQPVETVRRWEAPDSGSVQLKGTFLLRTGDYASCSVLLRQQGEIEEHVLFTQILDSVSKKAAGMEGDFFLHQGDQLSFITSGPAVMTGGDVVLDVQMQLGADQYNSYSDFSSEQGKNGWYYEQRFRGQTSLMIWNPEEGHWESPLTRSWQDAEALVCRSGVAGDAFESARRFFEELRLMGIHDVNYLLPEWNDHARIAPPPNAHHSELVWGSAACLLELSKKEQDVRNSMMVVVRPSTLGVDQSAETAAVLLSAAMGAGPSPVEALRSAFWDYLTKNDPKMNRKGMMLQVPALLHKVPTAGAWYALLGAPEYSTRSAVNFLERQVSDIRKVAGIPLLLDWRDAESRFDLFDPSLFDGIAAPLDSTSNVLNLVDESVRVDRVQTPRIGFGTYAGFLQVPQSDAYTDLRLFPLDQYMTSILAFARVPLISCRVWSPDFRGQDIRRYLLEMAALLQPVANEYLNPENTAVQIRYQTPDEPGKELSVEEVLIGKVEEKATRVRVQYENGLQIYANRYLKPWLVRQENNTMAEISGDGFLAVNPATGLRAIISRQGNNRYTLCQSVGCFFLNSRDGALVKYGSYATDGMVRRWKNAYSEQDDMACLGTTEVDRADPLVPLLRSNQRVDCCVRWKSASQVEIHIMDAGQGPTLLEFFDVPAEWLDDQGKRLTIQKQDKSNSEPVASSNWYLIRSVSNPGIRFVDIRDGEVYTITLPPGTMIVPKQQEP